MLTSEHPSVRDKYVAYTNRGFLLNETSLAARALLEGRTAEELRRDITKDDLFQLPALESRKTAANAVLSRLSNVSPRLLELLAYGSIDVRRSTNLYLILLRHRLLRELVIEVLEPRLRSFETAIKGHQVQAFMARLRAQEPAVAEWSESTFQKARTNAVRLLIAGGLLEPVSRSAYRIKPAWVPTEVRSELERADRTAYLRLLLDQGGEA